MAKLRQIRGFIMSAGLSLFAFIAHAQEFTYLVNCQKIKQTAGIQTPCLISGDSSYVLAHLTNLQAKMKDQGFWGAYYTVDSITPDTVTAEFIPGDQYRNVTLQMANVQSASFLDVDSMSFTNWRKYQWKTRDIISELANTGYPFAKLQVDSVSLDNGEIALNAQLHPGPKITFDSLMVGEQLKTRPQFLADYLFIRQGKPYDERKVNAIPQKIDRLNFLALKRQPNVHFHNLNADIYLTLTEPKVNTFEGVIGFLANDAEGFVLTGTLDLELMNLFGSGNDLRLNWQRLKSESQTLDLNYIHRRIFHSPLNYDVAFSFFRQDTSFLTRHLENQLQVDVFQLGQLGLNYDLVQSRIITAPEDFDINPEVIDASTNYYGLSVLWDNYTRRLRKGFILKAEAWIGEKEVFKNTAINEHFYDSLNLSQTQQKYLLEGQYYIPVYRYSSVFLQHKSAWVIADQLFVNDMFPLGGLRSVRGFNEYQFFASNYHFINLEWRQFTGEGSYLFLFYDQGYYQKATISAFQEDWPLGLGAGISLKTNNGTFNLVYAVGKSNTQDFDFANSKVHFGFVNKF